LLSDHGISGGMSPLQNLKRPVHDALERQGFRVSRHLRTSDDVVLVVQGLVSSVAAYTLRPRREEVAQAMASVDGVDLCVVSLEEGVWRLWDGGGAALLTRSDSGASTRWHYQSESSDPLGYQGQLAGLAGEGGWVEDDAVQHRTQWSRFPDAFHRIEQAFDLVQNPASILCSLDSGSMFGASRAEAAKALWTGRLRWTHGSLEAEASRGFLLTDHPRFRARETVRFDEALKFLLAPVGAGGIWEDPCFGPSARLCRSDQDRPVPW
jgi:hypothetical protein